MGSLLAQPHETWDYQDGAPEGIPFDVLVPSVSVRDRTYRVARFAVERCVVHVPACPAWRAGRRRCRHLHRALMVAEEPLRTLAVDILEAWAAGGWRPGQPREEFGAAIYRAAQDAVAQLDRLDEWDGVTHRPATTPADLADFIGDQNRDPAGRGLRELVASRPWVATPLASDDVRAREGVRLAEEALGREVTP